MVVGIRLLNNSFFAKMICHVYLFYTNIINFIIPYITFLSLKSSFLIDVIYKGTLQGREQVNFQ